VFPFCHSRVTLSLSSLVGILSTPVRSWSFSFQCFQIVQLKSHSASVRFLAQKGALFHWHVAVICSCCIASNCLAVCPRRKLCQPIIPWLQIAVRISLSSISSSVLGTSPVYCWSFYNFSRAFRSSRRTSYLSLF
jgi:hypothetical protein